MRALEPFVLAYLLNSLWQVPLVFCAALAAARLARPAGAQMEHRIWVGAFLIEVLLPLCHLQMSELWQRAWGLALWFRHASVAGGETRVILGGGAASQVALPWLTAQILAVIATVYVCCMLYFAGRLAWGVWKTDAMRRRAEPLALTQQTVLKVNRLGRFPGTGTSAVLFASTSAITGPATVGVLQQTLLLPPGFLDRLGANDLNALLAHEFAHMSRLDFAKNLLYGIISLPVAYHPLLALTRARLAETRELVCDAMAAEAIGGREIYARSLLRLASMLSDRPAPGYSTPSGFSMPTFLRGEL